MRKSLDYVFKYPILGLIFAGLSMHLWGADQILDAKFFYTATQAQTFFQSLDSSEWRAYVINEALDLVFLTSYSFLFFLLARKFSSKKYFFAFVPGVLDLIETTTIILLLINRNWPPPFWLGFVTSLKWITGTIGVIWLMGEFAKSFRKIDRV